MDSVGAMLTAWEVRPSGSSLNVTSFTNHHLLLVLARARYPQTCSGKSLGELPGLREQDVLGRDLTAFIRVPVGPDGEGDGP